MSFFPEDALSYTKLRSLSLAEARMNQSSDIRTRCHTGSGTLLELFFLRKCPPGKHSQPVPNPDHLLGGTFSTEFFSGRLLRGA